MAGIALRPKVVQVEIRLKGKCSCQAGSRSDGVVRNCGHGRKKGPAILKQNAGPEQLGRPI
ncbi:MAG: hypothetical protein Fues2KO_48660 [Fuerstiella sp.]